MCNFLEKSYDTYGTRFDNNLTLFEFQCALSCGLEEPVKSKDEVLIKSICGLMVLNYFLEYFEEGAFCIAADYRFIFDEVVRVGEELYSDIDNQVEWEIYDHDLDYENALVNRGYKSLRSTG